jgi:hypothetical protein
MPVSVIRQKKLLKKITKLAAETHKSIGRCSVQLAQYRTVYAVPYRTVQYRYHNLHKIPYRTVPAYYLTR